MRYFLLSQSKLLKNPLAIVGLDSNVYKHNIHKKDFEGISKLLVAYFENTKECEIPAVLERPTLMISNEMKQLFQLYTEDMQFKGIQVFSQDVNDTTAMLYWIFQCKEIDCLHTECKIYPNGTIEELILDKNKITKEDIFKVGNTTVNKILISLPLAESILRRNWFGVGLQEVKIM